MDINLLDFAGMVTQAMAPKHAADKTPEPLQPAKPFWRFPTFKRKSLAYKGLKNTDGKPVKAALETETSDIPEDTPLLKVGASDAAAENKKYGRSQSMEDDEEPFVPNPRSKVMFNLPEKTKAKSKEATTQEPSSITSLQPTAEDAEQSAATSSSALIGTEVQPPVADTGIQPVAPSNVKESDAPGHDLQLDN